MMRCVFLICFVCITQLVWSQDSELQLNTELWEKTIKDVDYDQYDQERRKKKEKKEVVTPSADSGQGVQIIAYVLFGALVVFILIVLFRRMKAPTLAIKTQKRIEAESLAEAEENLPLVDLNRIFDEAIEKGEYKVALRIRFLMVLQKLIDAGLVKWKQSKTNEQYVRELTQTEIQNNFSQIVWLFDEVWYGNRGLLKMDFDETMTKMEDLNIRIHGK